MTINQLRPPLADLQQVEPVRLRLPYRSRNTIRPFLYEIHCISILELQEHPRLRPLCWRSTSGPATPAVIYDPRPSAERARWATVWILISVGASVFNAHLKSAVYYLGVCFGVISIWVQTVNEDSNPLQWWIFDTSIKCFALVKLTHCNSDRQPEFSPPVLGRTFAELDFGTECVWGSNLEVCN